MPNAISSGLSISLPARTEPFLESNDLAAASPSFKTATLGFLSSITLLYASVFLLGAMI